MRFRFKTQQYRTDAVDSTMCIFRDRSMADDSVATNFDQIFETYSPSTVRNVL